MPAAEFSAEIGVNARTLTYWKWKLGRPERSAESRKAEFVEVAPSEIAGAPMVAPSERLEVVLGDGVVIRVPERFDADALRRVVAALGGA